MTPLEQRRHERLARRWKPGTRVQSSYRVPWLGTIESVTGSIAVVTITHDREGRELLKPLRGRVMHVAWLAAINA